MEANIKGLERQIFNEAIKVLNVSWVRIVEVFDNEGEKDGFNFSLFYNGIEFIDFHCYHLHEVAYKWEQLKKMLEFLQYDKSIYLEKPFK